MNDPYSTDWSQLARKNLTPAHPALRYLLAAFVTLGLSQAVHASVTSLRLSSQPGDYIGGGANYFYTPSNGTFTAQGALGYVSVSFYTPSHFWYLDFAAVRGQPLAVGTYPGATRYPFEEATEPGLSVYGDGRGCNMLTGNFEIKEVDVGIDGTVHHFWATFEQHCDGNPSALFGEIRYQADVILDLSAPSVVELGEAQSLNVAVVATDALSRHVTLTASNLPSGAQFTDNGNNTGTLSWTPARGQLGSYTVTFIGDNGAGVIASTTSRITVNLANDDFDHPIVIASLPYSDAINTATATAAIDDPYSGCGSSYGTVWYALTLNRDTHIEANTLGSDYGAILSIYTGSRGSLRLVECSYQPEVKFGVQAGETYHIMVSSSSFFSSGSNLVLSVNELLPPPNDDIANATPVAFFPGTNSVDTMLATRATDDPADCVRFGPTVWFSFAPTEDTFIDVRTLTFQGALAGYVGSRGALQPLFCFGGGEWGFPTLAGNTYYFLVGSDQSTNLQYSFFFYRFPLLKIGITIDAIGSVDHKTGAASVSGTVTSSQPVTICLVGTVRQKVGRFHIISGKFGDPGSQAMCLPPGQSSWSVQVLGDSGSFGGGAGLVEVSAFAMEPLSRQYANAQASATVQFKGANK